MLSCAAASTLQLLHPSLSCSHLFLLRSCFLAANPSENLHTTEPIPHTCCHVTASSPRALRCSYSEVTAVIIFPVSVFGCINLHSHSFVFVCLRQRLTTSSSFKLFLSVTRAFFLLGVFTVVSPSGSLPSESTSLSLSVAALFRDLAVPFLVRFPFLLLELDLVEPLAIAGAFFVVLRACDGMEISAG